MASFSDWERPTAVRGAASTLEGSSFNKLLHSRERTSTYLYVYRGTWSSTASECNGFNEFVTVSNFCILERNVHTSNRREPNCLQLLHFWHLNLGWGAVGPVCMHISRFIEELLARNNFTKPPPSKAWSKTCAQKVERKHPSTLYSSSRPVAGRFFFMASATKRGASNCISSCRCSAALGASGKHNLKPISGHTI